MRCASDQEADGKSTERVVSCCGCYLIEGNPCAGAKDDAHNLSLLIKPLGIIPVELRLQADKTALVGEELVEKAVHGRIIPCATRSRTGCIVPR